MSVHIHCNRCSAELPRSDDEEEKPGLFLLVARMSYQLQADMQNGDGQHLCTKCEHEFEAFMKGRDMRALN